ncbi:MAG: D-3-phosphoglycerate dehydrogenase / 2-oxoglutarate reductase [Verrucomicrobiota bacterium]|jgi:D-3-phosphoglycerate dehydrogenase
MTTPLKVLVADPISQRGIEELTRENRIQVEVRTGLTESQILQIISDVHGLIVRSQTKVTAAILKAGKLLRVVGRAGVGVDNVDIETATRRGVLVLNAPGANTVSTAEHAFSLLLSLARNIARADATLKAGVWDRKNLEGVELYNKTLGIIGMGRIGSELSRRAIAFGMRVLAFDPYLSATRARSLQVELVEEIDDLLAAADFISLHTPLTEETHHILNAERLAKTKSGVRIINCARGGLIDEPALADALHSGQVAGAALDVFETEPLPTDSCLRAAPNMVLTPHLGASTAEAQESVGIEIAQSIRAALLEGTIRNAVNMPSLDAKTLAIIGPHLRFGEKLGRFLSQLAPRRVDHLNINYSGKVNEVDTTAITRAVLKGFLQNAGGAEVNEINAPAFAESLGLKLTETRLSAPGDYVDMLEISAAAEGKSVSVGGAFFGATPRIVSVNNRPVEARPSGVVLVLENTDRPGMVGRIGTLLGNRGVNIATMSLSRNQAGGTALTVLNLDSAPGEELLKEIRASADIRSAQVIEL